MRDISGPIVGNFFNALFSAGPVRLIAAFAITGLVAAALLGLVFRSNSQDKALLYSGLDLGEAAEIASRLDTQGIKYELRGDGSAVFVPRAQVAAIRLRLSQDGLPSRGSVGYEIFDKQDALGSTSFVQNVNRIRALQGELERTIQSLDGVSAAKVLLVIPERRLFEQSKDQPSASIKVTLARAELTADQVRAIRNLVASAVPGLAINRVTIADQRGKLLAAGAEGDESGGGAAAADAREIQFEERLKKTLTDLVESVTGPGSARVQVAADLDLARVTKNSETYDPDGQVVRSTTTTDEQSTSQDQNARQGATAAANVPDGTAQGAAAGADSDASRRTEETTNYEISKTIQTEVQDGGQVKRLSVAVAVDYNEVPGAAPPPAQPGKKAGKKAPAVAAAPPTFEPRSAEDIQKITALVRSGMGFDAQRGDTLEVVNVQFARAPLIPDEPKKVPISFNQNDIFRAVELGIFTLTALTLIFFVIRPLVTSVVRGGPIGRPGLAGGGLALAGLPQHANYDSGLPPPAGLPSVGGAPETETLDDKIDVARVQGQVRASSVKRISEVVESQPDQSVAIIRQWLHEGA